MKTMIILIAAFCSSAVFATKIPYSLKKYSGLAYEYQVEYSGLNILKLKVSESEVELCEEFLEKILEEDLNFSNVEIETVSECSNSNRDQAIAEITFFNKSL